jgi:hypothetical protein
MDGRGIINYTVGDRVGKWTVSGPVAHIGVAKNRAYPVICDCGNRSVVVATALKNRKSVQCTSCGHRLTGQKRQIEVRAQTTTAALAYYKKAAQRRDILFELSKEEFETIIYQNCFYCGRPPSNTVTIRRLEKVVGNYSGVDRISPLEGYTKTNCVPCCRLCNESKRTMTLEEFKKWISKVYERLCT